MKSTAKYVWTKEKALGIQHARKPQEGHCLSGVVLVLDKGTGYCHIKFEEEAVETLGHRMPYGIGPEDLSYLKVVKLHGHYDVWCCYKNKSKALRLWRADIMPDWVKGVKYSE